MHRTAPAPAPSQHIRRRITIAWLCAVLAGLPLPLRAATPATPAPDPRPNLVLILADDLGYGDLGCYGQQEIRTPRLDRMAAEGVRFTQYYAGSHEPAASRAVLLTGAHTGNPALRHAAAPHLQTNQFNLAKSLKSRGYRTAVFGSWGLGPSEDPSGPLRHGFDEWFGYPELDAAQDYFPETLWRNHLPIRLDRNANGRKGDYSHDWFTRAATNFVTVRSNSPFFLFLSYSIPRANTRLARQNGNGMEAPHDAPYASQPWPQPEKNKAAMITRLDRDVGLLLDFLHATGQDRRTLVVFTSDNGPHAEGGVSTNLFRSAGPLRGGKGDLLEGGLRVPLIVRWPGRIPGGATNHLPCAAWDLAPTLAEATGATLPAGLDGVSLLPALEGRGQAPDHEYLYWAALPNPGPQALRSGNWKMLKSSPTNRPSLYNLDSDPRETQNVANEHPDVASRLDALLRRLAASPPAGVVSPQFGGK